MGYSSGSRRRDGSGGSRHRNNPAVVIHLLPCTRAGACHLALLLRDIEVVPIGTHRHSLVDGSVSNNGALGISDCDIHQNGLGERCLGCCAGRSKDQSPIRLGTESDPQSPRHSFAT